MTDSLGASLIPSFAAKKVQNSRYVPPIEVRSPTVMTAHPWPWCRRSSASPFTNDNKEIAFIKLYIVLDSKYSINNYIGASVFALARRNEQEYRPL